MKSARAATFGSPFKVSGQPWLGTIPEHWAVSKFSRCIDITEGQVDPEVEPYRDLPLIAPNHIESGTGRLLFTETASEQAAISGKYLCKAGDVLYSKIRPALRKAIVATKPCLCSADMYPFSVSQSLIPKYVLWLILSEAFTAWAVLESDRVAMPKINRESLSDIRIPIPPLETQQRIVAYLDRETERIDALIAAKERLLALLAEKRGALITHAVTRGLNPHAPLRNSGLPWLGKIPGHWDVIQLKRLAQVVDCKHRTVPFVSEGVPLASIREVQSWSVDLSHAKMTTEDEYLQMIEGGREPRVGDVIVSRNATVGAAAMVSDDAKFCMGQDVSLIRPHNKLRSEFLNWLFRSDVLTTQILLDSIGSTFSRINVEQIGELLIPIPPVVEQQTLSIRLASETLRFNAIRVATQRTIDLLRERRSALIAAAVNGQLEVEA